MKPNAAHIADRPGVPIASKRTITMCIRLLTVGGAKQLCNKQAVCPAPPTRALYRCSALYSGLLLMPCTTSCLDSLPLVSRAQLSRNPVSSGSLPSKAR
jgi:hypothetical protein